MDYEEFKNALGKASIGQYCTNHLPRDGKGNVRFVEMKPGAYGFECPECSYSYSYQNIIMGANNVSH